MREEVHRALDPDWQQEEEERCRSSARGTAGAHGSKANKQRWETEGNKTPARTAEKERARCGRRCIGLLIRIGNRRRRSVADLLRVVRRELMEARQTSNGGKRRAIKPLREQRKKKEPDAGGGASGS